MTIDAHGYTFTFTRLVSNETTKVCSVETLSKCKRAFRFYGFLFYFLFYFESISVFYGIIGASLDLDLPLSC
jgi:hypothetical protein